MLLIRSCTNYVTQKKTKLTEANKTIPTLKHGYLENLKRSCTCQ